MPASIDVFFEFASPYSYLSRSGIARAGNASWPTAKMEAD